MFSSITVLYLGVMVLLQRGSSVFLNEHRDDKNLHNVPHNISLTEREGEYHEKIGGNYYQAM